MYLACYSRLRQGKKLIKYATTVTNRGKPRNIRSMAAKSHKWLWCTKKPPKTEDHATESTHHQRAHVRNAKHTMFGDHEKDHILLISMDDKAYLRPGTDVGTRATKTGVIYGVIDPELEKNLRQHNFNHLEVNQTPAFFRFIKQHIPNIDGKDELISDKDQSVVVVRPKHYIGSSGTVWPSDYMRLCHVVPAVYQENPDNSRSNLPERLVVHLHEVVSYFIDITLKEDVVCATAQPGC